MPTKLVINSPQKFESPTRHSISASNQTFEPFFDIKLIYSSAAKYGSRNHFF